MITGFRANYAYLMGTDTICCSLAADYTDGTTERAVMVCTHNAGQLEPATVVAGLRELAQHIELRSQVLPPLKAPSA